MKERTLLNPWRRLASGGDAGFTFVEAAISLAIFSIVMIGAMTIATEVSRFAGNADANLSIQAESNRTIKRLTELLRKTGWSTLSTVEFPRVTSGGSELQFLVLRDADGNGHAFDEATGELEWSPVIFSIRVDPADSMVKVYAGGNEIRSLGRYASALRFATVNEDNTLHFKEIEVELVNQREDEAGRNLSYTATSSIHMRN